MDGEGRSPWSAKKDWRAALLGDTYEEGLAAYHAGQHYKAHACITNAARKGDPGAHVLIGLMYYNGLGTEKDYAKAAVHFNSAFEAIDE